MAPSKAAPQQPSSSYTSLPAALLVAAPLILLACASAPPAQPSSPDTDAAPTSAAGDGGATADAPAAPPADASAKAAPPVKERDADDSDPEGLNPLKDDERKVLEGECKKFSDAVAKSVANKKLEPGASRNDQVLWALEKPPQVKGVDVPKCTELMRRDLIVYSARQAETQAKNNLKLIAVNLGVAFGDGKKLCPSAGPTPASLEGLKNGAVATTAGDWAAPGWSCVRFGPSTVLTRWQYELKTDKGAGTWEVIARGHPVPGAPPTTLVMGGVIDAGGPTPPGAVKRR
jgi:hypothetical protein